jgi:riboflavin biosynthesis pyrimidine reductase
MRRLLPPPVETVDDIEAVYSDPRRRPLDGRPWVLANMICSADGATAREGRSGGLGSPADRAVFAALRRLADTVLVGASTVRQEGYGPPKKPGQRIAVVTKSGDVDWSAALFTSGAGLAVLPHAAAAVPVDTIRAGEEEVDFVAALAALGERGAKVVLAEGGPVVIGQLAAASVLDELCLTISPLLLSGNAARVAHGPAADDALELVDVLEEDGFLFLRYLRRP